MKEPRRGRFSWNLGGLIGSAVGCSAWMALTPFLAARDLKGIIVALGCVMVILLAVPVLWSMRAGIEALRGIFILLAVAFVATLSFLLFAHFMSLPLLASWPPSRPAEASNFFWILLLYPALVLVFGFINRSGRKPSGEQG